MSDRGFVEASSGFLHLPDRGAPLLRHQELQQLQGHVIILCAGETNVKAPPNRCRLEHRHLLVHLFVWVSEKDLPVKDIHPVPS